MAVNLKGRHFLKLQDFTKEELIQILDTADFIKMRKKIGVEEEILKGKTLAMIFEKSLELPSFLSGICLTPG